MEETIRTLQEENAKLRSRELEMNNREEARESEKVATKGGGGISTFVILCTTLNDTEKLLPICQEAAKDFIGKAVNISKADYTSSDVDILFLKETVTANGYKRLKTFELSSYLFL
ncbi:hypothetical protein Tco_0155982 [Tanacetum coccineum]